MELNPNYGIELNYFINRIGLKKSVELVAKAGFKNLDYTPKIIEDGWKDEMKEAVKIFNDYNLTVHQTHMPFNRYGRHGDKHKLYMDRCAEATELMGAKFAVVHGDEFDFENLTFTPERALEYNHEYFLPYVERAQKNGYKIAFETVFEDWDRRRFTSDEKELKALILSYNSQASVCCWDFGHGNVSYWGRAADIIRDFGSLVQCTHVHDNTGMDSHQMPLSGDLNWSKIIGAFKDIGYDGVMNIEYSHGNYPEHLTGEFLDLTYKALKYVCSL